MAEIIKQGNTHNIAVCEHCECIFSYSPYEIQKSRGHYIILCPDCLRITIVEKVHDENTTQED